MTSIDITSLGAAPSPDATGASAEAPAGAADMFAAFLDDAAGTTGTPAEASSEDAPSEGGDQFDDLAALAMTSLLCLGATAPPPTDADGAGEVAGTEVTATEITDQSVVTDLTDRAVIVDVSMSSRLTTTAAATIANDMGVAPNTAPVMTGAHARETLVASTADVTPESASIDAATPNPGGSAAPVAESEAVEIEGSLGAATASAGKAEADVKPAVRTSRPSKPSRGEQVNDTHKADSPNAGAVTASSLATAAQTIETTRASSPAPQAADVRTSGSAAARFARALERAATPAASEATSSAPSAAANSSGSGQQSGWGDSTPDHAARLSAAIRQSAPNVMAFTVNGPVPMDTRAMTAAVAHTAGHADAPVAIPERDVIAQLVQSMRVQLRDGIGEAVVKLKPEHLGSVQISVRIENGAIKATVQAEAPAVRQWLESQQDTLRTSLADQGLRLERFIVEPDGERRTAPDDTAREQKEQRRRQQRRMSEKDQPIFEVTV